MRQVTILIGVLLAIAVFLLCVTSSLQLVAFDLSFYQRHLAALGVAQELKVDFPTLMTYVEALVAYLQGNRPTPNMVTVVRGQESLLFGEREIKHMEDVRHLFALAALLRNLSLLAVVSLSISTLALRAWRRALLGYSYAAGAVLLMLLLLSVWAVIDFNSIFTVFHLVSFSNDLWLLDPATENLIVIFPEPFFAAAALSIAAYATGGYMLTLIGATILYRKNQWTVK